MPDSKRLAKISNFSQKTTKKNRIFVKYMLSGDAGSPYMANPARSKLQERTRMETGNTDIKDRIDELRAQIAENNRLY